MCDLHLREKRIEHLEAENSALAAAAVVVAKPGDGTTVAKLPFSLREHPRSLQNAGEDNRTPMEDKTAADNPAASVQIRNTCTSDGMSEGGYASRARCASNTRKSDVEREGGYVSRGGAYASNLEQEDTAEEIASSACVTLRGCEFEGQSYEGGGEKSNDACTAEVTRGMGTKCVIPSAAAAAPNVASIARPTRRQLNPQFAVIPGRVTAISYPRCGSRVTIERPVEKKPLNENKGKEPGGGMEAADKRASDVTPKVHDDTEQVEALDVAGKAYDDAGKMKALDDTEKAYDDAGKLDAQRGCDEQAAPCPEPPLARRLGDGRVVGLTPAPPFPRRPSNLPADCTFSKTAPLLSDGSVCTATCTPDAKLRVDDTLMDSLEDKRRLGDVESASVAEETRFGGTGGISGSTEGGGQTNGGVEVGSAATPRLGINDHRNGEEERRDAPPSASVREDKGEAHSVEARLPAQSTKNEGPMSDMFASRLVDGVPVLKYGGQGKPKPKVLWVTPDLSELFYTRVGR